MTAAAARPLTERAMQDGILHAARALKFRAYHVFDSRRSAYGFPDTIIVGHGHVIAFELKSKRGRVTEAQQGWIDAFAANGAIAKIITPAEYDAALDLLAWIAADATEPASP